MYRNVDGNGAGFGEISIRAASADPGKLAVYAARRATGGALTVMVINKTGAAQQSTLSLQGFAPAGSAQVFRYSAAHLDQVWREADQALLANGFSATYPPESITLLVLPPAQALNWRQYLPLIDK
jgi:hypothetical protein